MSLRKLRDTSTFEDGMSDDSAERDGGGGPSFDGSDDEESRGDLCEENEFAVGNKRVLLVLRLLIVVLLVSTGVTAIASLYSKPQMGSAMPLATTVAVLFVLLLVSFLFYDFFVRRYEREAYAAAVKSTRIVTSLFPTKVAERLFLADENHLEDIPVDKTVCTDDDRSGGLVFKEPPKHVLKHVLKDDLLDGLHNPNDMPIADFFPACTVLFADIAGFTAFASERPPEQVFQLLQAVYQAFDKEARKRHVFKVETIGDCYVAVTGLPEPQPDHAVIMSRFAIHCRSKMKEVTRKLERTLGPDTSSLAMRFGLHSGPIIGGVLRGERARFQLFGDTVNTAARMESTGHRDFIQISEATAELLMKAGKEEWVSPREELVSVKGKGQMKTYWLARRDSSAQRTKLSSQISCDSVNSSALQASKPKTDSGLENSLVGRDAMKAAKREIWARSDIDMPPPTTLQRGTSEVTHRLIDWNAQVLLNLLKPVVMHRAATKGYPSGSRGIDFAGLTSHEGCALDEIREIIELPNVVAFKTIKRVVPGSLEVSPEVECELREYVAGIASMYRDNPFHNYQHACHVQMSMVKLLQRVVSPDTVDYRGAREAVASDVHSYTFGITSDPLTSFAVVFSALIHDVDHYGVTNGQLVKENVPVAIFYKGKSVAEQNSIDLAWELLMQPNFKELRSCIFADQEEFLRFRQLVVNVVLATDIFDKELSALRKERWSKAFAVQPVREPAVDRVNRKATIVLEHLIQASDVSHTMQHWEVYRKWNERLFQEMRLAFRSGRLEADPAASWYAGETWFFDNNVIPLARKLQDCGVFGVSSDECLNYALENRRMWVAHGEEIVREMLATDPSARSSAEQKVRRSQRKQNRLDWSLH